ncbi:MAG TPA: serine--tRNA ligase [Solirubrobacteraceae bacterium]|nr:serine--tRNA ligase [Solirubrobacteraceae bacterium]
MLDIKRIRQERETVEAALGRRDPALRELVAAVVAKDSEWRSATTDAESLRAKQREHSDAVAAGKRTGADVSGELEKLKEISTRVKLLGEQATEARAALDALLLKLPNLPDPTAAPGPEDELVRVVGDAGLGGLPAGVAVGRAGQSGVGEGGAGESGAGKHGASPQPPFTPRDHLELAGELIDMEHAAKLSGARFAYLKGDLVMLELALVRWALEKLRGHGFEPVVPPVLVRERALYGTGFLPDTEQQIYELPADDLYLVGTSEVALASLHDEEIVDAERLPLRYAGFSPCFRREAGAAGKDTRGIFRVHQFDKVEMYSFVEPERSTEEHERILAIEEQILGELHLPYRVMNIAVNDLGAPAAKKWDCEAWLPSQGRYRELTSCSNTTDFQARRLNIRVRRQRPGGRGPGGGGAGGHDVEVLHTLNGTAVAVGRTIIALLENGQREDGGVVLPECLAPFGAPEELPACV